MVQQDPTTDTGQHCPALEASGILRGCTPIDRLPALRVAAASASERLIQERGLWLSAIGEELESFSSEGRLRGDGAAR